MMADGTVMRDSDHNLAEELASTADMLLARPDLWWSDPLPRAEPLVSDPTTVGGWIQNWTASKNGHFDWQNEWERSELDRVQKWPH